MTIVVTIVICVGMVVTSFCYYIHVVDITYLHWPIVNSNSVNINTQIVW